VCVWRLSQKGFEVHWYNLKQLDFLNKRENQWNISQKSNLIFYLYHEGQDKKLIQHRSSEYRHITRNLEE
jgi:hypothetical protein